eukprot:TRINITY_DN5548_c0_g1_i1.p1 TRINITY_DN5548_c0_g1~~TRINITY_DN5548_c0_g1_i1.p1  ORF type:complete len:135 (-),score=46.57 TRINITY_DN5548_c0_g1_i1:37-441(-)
MSDLPKATLAKVLNHTLPPDVKFSPDTIPLMLDCCLEFIELLTSEANDICTQENKKVMTPEHLLKALEVLQFTEYVPEVKETLEKFRQTQASAPKLEKKVNVPSEQLLREQQELFAKARLAMEAQEKIKQQTNQ